MTPPVETEPHAEGPIIESETILLQFSEMTGGIVDLVPGGSDAGFVSKGHPAPLLWRLKLRDESGTEVDVDNATQAPPTFDRVAGQIALRWTSVGLPDGESLSVRVTARVEPGFPHVLLRLALINRSARFGLWHVDFPVVSSLGHVDKAEVAVPRGNWGMLYKNPSEPLSGVYPSFDWPMQFILLGEGENGLYLAAHDHLCCHKQFLFQAGKEFSLRLFPENMGQPGKAFDLPYVVALAAYRGDWMAGCKMYRAWAGHQPWARGGKLSGRRDTPDFFKKIGIWLVTGWDQGKISSTGRAHPGGVPAVAGEIDECMSRVDVPVAAHWYNWHQIDFDVDYPNYFPAREGFADAVKGLVDRGVTIMPYINGRLWDIAAPNFAEALPYATKDESGQVNTEEYGSGAKLAAMCPSTRFWQDKVLELVQRLVDEENVNAVYIDQIGAAAPRLCFDESHPHVPGGGSYWVQSYRQMLHRIQAWRQQQGRSIAITTENNAEPFMDCVDGFLIWLKRSQEEIPMDMAVYSGYTIYFATPVDLSDGDVAFAIAQARDFVWGAQPGWVSPLVLEPEHTAKLEFLNSLATLRLQGSRFFLLGELLGFLPDDPSIPSLSSAWSRGQELSPVTLPAVVNAVWRGGDGSTGIFVANADTEEHCFSFFFDGARWGLGSASTLTLSRHTAGGKPSCARVIGNTFPGAVTVPARSAALLVISASRGFVPGPRSLKSGPQPGG